MKIGFKINPYNSCVTNKEINGKQFAMVWHMDGPKLYFGGNNELTRVIRCLKFLCITTQVSRKNMITLWKLINKVSLNRDKGW